MRIAVLLLISISVQGCTNISPENGKGDVIMEYTPVQCIQTPWDEWYAEGNIQFVTEPTQEELIIAYYSQEYNIDLDDVTRLKYTGDVCDTCKICRENYSFVADVESEDVETMQNMGWLIYPIQ